MLARKFILLHLPCSHIRRGLQDRSDRLLARAIDGVEVDDHVSWFVDEIAEDGVDAEGGVLDEYTGVEGDIEEGGDCSAGGEEVVWGLVAHESVWAGLGEGLEVVQGG